MWQHEDTGRWLDERWTLDDILDGDGYPYGTRLRRYYRVKTREYTGLKDKNGKEIYEGDIVKVRALYDTAIGHVVYIDTSFKFKLPDVDKFSDPHRDIGTGWYGIEVIGNIYENPELLEVSDEKEA
ncbi:hypothetical protein KAR91_36780 [Candidatus Pacearchaeota archaeon]|nr:hypothetical protein [Candidatus Pacearchaeota archaeon]